MTLLRNCIITFFVFFLIILTIVLSDLFISKNKTVTITEINRSHCGISMMGPQGDIGPVGETGDRGTEGVIGPEGYEGEIGQSIIGNTGPTGRIGKNAVRPKLEILDGNVINNIYDAFANPQNEDANFIQLSGGVQRIDLNRPNCPVTSDNANSLGKGYMFAFSYDDVPKCNTVLSTVNMWVRSEFIDRIDNVNGVYYKIKNESVYSISSAVYYLTVVYLVYGNYYPETMKNLYLLSNTRYIDESIPVLLTNTTNNTLFSNIDNSVDLNNTTPVDSFNFAFLNPAIRGGYGLSTDFEFYQTTLLTRQDNYESLHTPEEPVTKRFLRGYYTINNLSAPNRIFIFPYLKYISFLPRVDSKTINIDKSLLTSSQPRIKVSWVETGAISYKILILDQNNQNIFYGIKSINDEIVIENYTNTNSYRLYIIGIFNNDNESMKSNAVVF